LSIKDELQVNKITYVNKRSETLKSNPISEPWARFPGVSEVQASYILFEALVSCFDDLWKNYPANEREEYYSLKGSLFRHDQVMDKLNVTAMLKKVELMDTPTEFIHQLQTQC
jgi:hypothetical protein